MEWSGECIEEWSGVGSELMSGVRSGVGSELMSGVEWSGECIEEWSGEWNMKQEYNKHSSIHKANV